VVHAEFGARCRRTKIWHGVARQVKYKQNISAQSENCARWVLERDTKVVCTSYWRDREGIHSGFKVCEA
jgi:hypothetical protein